MFWEILFCPEFIKCYIFQLNLLPQFHLQLPVIFYLFCQISFLVVRVLEARWFAKLSSVGCEYRFKAGQNQWPWLIYWVSFLKGLFYSLSKPLPDGGLYLNVSTCNISLEYLERIPQWNIDSAPFLGVFTLPTVKKAGTWSNHSGQLVQQCMAASLISVQIAAVSQ